MDGKGFFIDLTRCTACRGCQVACKQWHNHPAEDTRNWGSFQNPPDLSYVTYKLVRMEEYVENGQVKDWLFFPDQCRHCIQPPCKMVGDMDDERAILQDFDTGAVLFTERTNNLFFDEILASCPYDIPRLDEATNLQGKCDMCFDRVINDKLPACVLVCPTGAMNFGDLDEMRQMADERLEVVKEEFPNAVLGDPNALRVIVLFHREPTRFHHAAVASLHGPGRFTRKQAFAKMFGNRKALI